MNVSLKPAQFAGAEAKRAQAFGGRHLLLQVNPVQYPGWDSLLHAHPDRCVFHTAAWARVLTETYGHEPAYFTHFYGGELAGLLPVMKVSSLFVGARAVSLPFTDYCPALFGPDCYQNELYKLALQWSRAAGCRFIEFRGNGNGMPGATPSLVFYGHIVDLNGGAGRAWERLDPAVRRGVRKAKEAGVDVKFSTEEEAVREFYRLHCKTRRRHGLPPQPYSFFRNIAAHILQHGLGVVATANWEGRAIAAAIFLWFGRRAVYKYGASDYAFQHLRPNNLVMWQAIEWLAERRYESLHLGRTSRGNEGLRRFKQGFGAVEETIAYYKFDVVQNCFVRDVDRALGWYNSVFRRLPVPVLRLVGTLLYKHIS
ncbi:MAG: GNAT family N-acetyltransferase [Verrucomicrobiae bacterium]|nr:GNAT family N-acetyltransferase [Verrucomicrobiae bacterium]